MDAAFSIVFLAIMVGVPVVMVVLIGGLVVRRVRDGRGRRRAVATGWEEVDLEDGGLQAILADLSIGGRCLAAYRRGPVWVVDHTSMRRSGPAETRTGSRRRLLLVPREHDGVRAVIAHRGPGLIEGMVDSLTRGLGAGPLEPPGWEWARVHGPPESAVDGFPGPEVSARVEALLGPGERLRLGRAWAALSLPEGPLTPLLEGAEERAAAVRGALATGPEGARPASRAPN